MKNLLLVAVVVLSGFYTAQAQNSKKEEKEKRKEEQYQAVVELVKAANFEFTGRKANPLKGRQIDLTTRQNFMRITGENAAADMPYFGRAFSGGYGSTDGGVVFDGPMTEYEMTLNDKKRRVTIKFKVQATGDTYNCSLNISSFDSASLSVSSNKKQSINYTGVVKTLEQEEEK